jgi:hypothetical protein
MVLELELLKMFVLAAGSALQQRHARAFGRAGPAPIGVAAVGLTCGDMPHLLSQERDVCEVLSHAEFERATSM